MSKEVSSSNDLGLSSVILSIVSLSFIFLTFMAFLAPLVGLVLSIIALVFALKQKKRNYNKWVKYGLILSIIGIVIHFLIVIGMISVLNSVSSQYEQLCDLAGGCENIPQYIQEQQAAGVYP